ncbi:shikimate dehydrogenase [Actinomyces israelii]|uniref:shikimate dehydrogenase n=1 Tax=Actinomyces israelii TaxID=1659 RepID=UPI002354347F|nr:shikimate dehydrogenase [Actinomyces israelii]
MGAPGAGGAAHRAAVIGRPVAHSLSPVLHAAAYRSLGLEDWRYEVREVSPARLRGMLAEVAAASAAGPVWAGLSVTMPHKQTVLPLLDAVDPLAAVVGAANTVVAQRAGRGRALLAGFNTDVAGIVGALREAAPAGGHDDVARAVVLGSGATACSALAALAELGATDIVVAARRHAGAGRAAAAAHRMGLSVTALPWRPGDAVSDGSVADLLAHADLVVSTLPAGAADALAAPMAAALERRGRTRAVMLDVVYAPWPTPLAAAWTAAGGCAVPGRLMLLYQAVPQVTLMTGRTPPVGPMREALEAAVAAR